MIETWQQDLPHGITLSCRASGQRGRPVLMFLHGFPEAAFVWDALLEHFARPEHGGYRCIAPNLRGYEQSSAPPSRAPKGTDEMTDDRIPSPTEVADLFDPDALRRICVADDFTPYGFTRTTLEPHPHGGERFYWYRDGGPDVTVLAPDINSITLLPPPTVITLVPSCAVTVFAPSPARMTLELPINNTLLLPSPNSSVLLPAPLSTVLLPSPS